VGKEWSIYGEDKKFLMFGYTLEGKMQTTAYFIYGAEIQKRNLK
jgi:hypothetical protein